MRNELGASVAGSFLQSTPYKRTFTSMRACSPSPLPQGTAPCVSGAFPCHQIPGRVGRAGRCQFG